MSYREKTHLDFPMDQKRLGCTHRSVLLYPLFLFLLRTKGTNNVLSSTKKGSSDIKPSPIKVYTKTSSKENLCESTKRKPLYESPSSVLGETT